MKLAEVREGEIFRFADWGHGYTTDTPLLCGGQTGRNGLVRVFPDIASKKREVNLWEGHEVIVIGRLYSRPIKKREL